MPREKTGLSVGFLFDDTLDSDNGVAQHVKMLGAWLAATGNEVSYLVGETKLESWAGGKVYSLARNVGVIFNGNRLSMPVISHKAVLEGVLNDMKFDVLHVMVPYSPFLSQRLIKLAPPGTAVVGTFHVFPAGILSRGGARLLRILNGRSLKRIGAMISVSQPAAEFCRQSLGVSSIIIPNPLDLSPYKDSARRQADSKTVVFLGRLVARKGCEQLIGAFAALVADMPDTRLIIAGDGPQRRELERLAARLGASNNIDFLGYIREADKPRLLASADIACFPSLYGESFGLVLVEAMAAGAKTILGGDNPGYRSVLGSQPDCLINPQDTAAFSARLKLLLTDNSLRQKLYQWQRQAVKQYDINVVGPQVEAVYRSAIARLDKNGHNS